MPLFPRPYKDLEGSALFGKLFANKAVMIIGLGIDFIEIARIRRALERFGPRFADKILHATEMDALCPSGKDLLAPQLTARIAARFAAKEAGVKALGTGFSGGICFHDLRVRSLASGKPELILHGMALERARELGAVRILLSLTHARDTAGAVVILEAP